MTPSLHSNRLVKALEVRARRDSTAAACFGMLSPIADDITPLLEFVRHSFPSYPKHGIDHSLRILERIGSILSSEALTSLSTYELFCLILAVLFHDAGMVAPDSTLPNDDSIRSEHHRRSAELFTRYFPDRIAVLSNNRMTKVISFTIECHGLTWEEMQDRPEFSRFETLDGQPIRPCVLAVLMRIGDLLDLDSDRTSEICLKYCASWYASPVAKEHNERHRHVKHFFYNDKRIEVEVECPNRKQYDIWFTWLEYLRMDIERANTYLFNDSLSAFRLPVPALKCTPSKDARFELWPLRFEIDESGTLWDVISKSIYTGKHDYLRELIQNSIDACLRRIYDNPNSVVINSSPRTWSLVEYTPTVLVVINSNQQEIIVADNGVGMGKHAIQDFLFRVAGSGMKRPNNDRAFRFPSIASFGIGFISVLTRAASLRLLTRSTSTASDNTFGFCIELDANLRDAIVEKEPNCPGGTSIVLKTRESSYLEGVEDYLFSTFQYTSVEICLIDWNKLDTLAEQLRQLDQANLLKDYESATERLRDRPGDIEGLRITVNRFVNVARRLIIDKNEERRRISDWQVGEEPPDLLPYPETPIHVFNARAPESLPTTSTWCFSLDNNSQVRDCTKSASSSSAGNSLAQMILVPVEFTDEERGIEWRSLHSFLVARGDVTQTVSFVRTQEFGSRSFVMPRAVITDRDAYFDEIMDQIEGSEDNPYDLVEVMRVRQERQRDYSESEEPSADFSGPMLIADRDGIKRYVDVDFASHEPIKEAEDEDFFDSTMLVSDEADNALKWYRLGRRMAYQDGIKLPISIGDIAPIGCVVGVANFLASSRVTYNVTRNAIDESEEKLRAWRLSVGILILEKIGRAVTESFNRLSIGYSWTDLWTGKKAGSLARSSEWSQIERMVLSNNKGE